MTGTPAASAIDLIPFPTCRVLPRFAPISRSGCVTTPTTSPGRSSSASSVGSANVPVPIITMRMRFLVRRLRLSAFKALSSKRRTSHQRRFLLKLGQRLLDLRVRRDLAALSGPSILRLEVVEVRLSGPLAEQAHFVDVKNPVQMIDLVLPQ